MPRYIDAEEHECWSCTHHASGKRDTWCDHGECHELREDVKRAKTVDVAPSIHSRWIYGKDGIIRCEKCKNHYGVAYPAVETNTDDSVTVKIKMSRYCCSCGAKMDGKEEA